MKNQKLGVTKSLEFLLVEKGAINTTPVQLLVSTVISMLMNEFNDGTEKENGSFSEALFDLVDPKRLPSGIPYDATHEVWPAMHSKLLYTVMGANAMNEITKRSVVESLMTLGGPNLNLIYQDYLSPKHGDNEVFNRSINADFHGTLNMACERGFPDVIRALSWMVEKDLADMKAGTGCRAHETAQRFSNAVSSMASIQSQVLLENVCATIDALIEIGYDIETFQSCYLADKFHLLTNIDGLLHAAAKCAVNDSVNSIEVMGYLASKGADPMMMDKWESTPADLISNPNLKKQWADIVRVIKTKNAAMDVLNELSVSTPGSKP